MSAVKTILLMKIQVSKKLNKIDLKLLQNCAVCGKEKSTFIKNNKLSND